MIAWLLDRKNRWVIWTVGGLIALRLFIGRIMGVESKLIPFVKKWEGGLSRDPDDNASSDPAPWTYKGKSGYHTNMGVTYSTFKSMAGKVGYEVTAQNFFNMSNAIWYGILKHGYMKSYPLEKLNHLPRIQAVIITWAWGSGTGGSERHLANFQREHFGIKDSDITKAEIVKNFTERVNPLNEKAIFNLLCNERESFFKRHEDYWKYGKGWLNRLNDFRATFG